MAIKGDHTCAERDLILTYFRKSSLLHESAVLSFEYLPENMPIGGNQRRTCQPEALITKVSGAISSPLTKLYGAIGTPIDETLWRHQ